MIVSNQKHSWVHCRHTQRTCHESCKQWAAKEWPTVIMSLTRSCNVCSMLLVVNSRNDIKWHRETAEKEILLWTGKGVLTLAKNSAQFSSVAQSCPVMLSWLFVKPHMATCKASLSITVSWSLLTHVHWVGDAIQSPHPLSSPLLQPSSFPTSGSFQMHQFLASGG